MLSYYIWKRVLKISSPSSTPLSPATNLVGPLFTVAYLAGPPFSATSIRWSCNSNFDNEIRHLKVYFAIFAIFEGLSWQYSNFDSGFAHNFVCCSIVDMESCLLLNGFIVFIDIDMYIEDTYSTAKAELLLKPLHWSLVE